MTGSEAIQPQKDTLQPHIQFLRGVAVLLVVLYHFDLGVLRGGYLGVDMFFVISGFIITKLYHGKILEGRCSVFEFLRRRLWRIVPSVLFLVAVTLLLSGFFLLPRDWESAGESGLYAVPFASNFFYWSRINYFSADLEYDPLIHLWSLGVEFQFYILFPFIVVAARQIKASQKIQAAMYFSLFLASLMLAAWATKYRPIGAFYLLPTRMWELLIGMLLGVLAGSVSERISPGMKKILFSGGFVLVMISATTFEQTTPTPGLIFLVPCLATALMLYCGAGLNLFTAGNFLAVPLIWLGGISFNLYLWHQPILAFFRNMKHGAPSPSEGLILFAGCVVIAMLAYRYIETPLRHQATKKQMPLLLVLMTSAIGVMLFGGLISSNRGFEQNFLARKGPAAVSAYSSIFADAGGWPKSNGCQLVADTLSPEFKAEYARCLKLHGPGVIITGDSHAPNYYNVVSMLGNLKFMVLLARPGCRISDLRTDCFFDELKTFVVENKSNISHILYVQAGFYLFNDLKISQNGRILFSRRDIPEYQIDESSLQRVITYLREISALAHVTLIGPRVNVHLTNRHLYSIAENAGALELNKFSSIEKNYIKLDNEIASRVKKESFHYVSMMQAVRFDPKSDISWNGILFWRDGDHWSAEGESRFGPRVIEPFMQILANQIRH